MRVINLFVEKEYRGKEMGRQLMHKAIETAQALGARGIVLETQSCNYSAVCLYRSCGLHFTGCDLTAYTNSDVADNEVRLELVKVF